MNLNIVLIIFCVLSNGLTSLGSSLKIDPMCKSCLYINDQLMVHTNTSSTNLTQFTLPGFSCSSITIDLRHLQYPLFGQNSQNISYFKLYFQIFDNTTNSPYLNQINAKIQGTYQYQLAVTGEVGLSIYFQILSEVQAVQYLLRDSIGFHLNYSNNRISSEDSSYVFFVTNGDDIDLPKNRPKLNNTPFYLESQIADTSSKYQNVDSTTYWGTEQQFAVPYFPYFSRCTGNGDMIHIMQLLQSSSCKLVPINETSWINEFNFGSSAIADECSYVNYCYYENVTSAKIQYPEWQTLPTLTTLFSMSQQKIKWKDYSYNLALTEDQMVPCKIITSSGDNSSGTYPLNVKLTMGYYQLSETQKRIIQCSVDYSLYVSSINSLRYQLEIVSEPLNHTYILLSFGFQWYIYMIVFLMIGFISSIEHSILWLYHYLVSEVSKPIKVSVYLRVIKEIIKGSIMGVFILMIVIFVVCIIMNGKIFQITTYNTNVQTQPRVIWDYILQTSTTDYSSSDVTALRTGRMGLSFMIIGVIIILMTCHFFIGKQKKADQYKDYAILGRVFRPLDWNRSKFLFGTLIYISIQIFLIYLAFSQFYSENIWTLIVMTKLLQMIMQQITKSVYDDLLPALPFKILTDITAYFNTLSANDFYSFLFSFLVDVAMTMIQKAYVSEIQNIVVDFIIEKSEEINKFYLHLMYDADEQIQQNKQNMQNDKEIDDQRVFIYRQAQDVQFYQQQINQIYENLTQEQQRQLIKQSQEAQDERIKKKYFLALTKQYNKQHQLLLKSQKQQQQQKQKPIQSRTHLNPLSIQQQDQQQLQKQSIIFELMLDNFALLYTFLLQPFVILIFWITYDESAVLSSYGITYNTVVLYNLSAIVIAIFTVLNIIVIFHILQSYFDISFQEPTQSLLDRFFMRKVFWKANDQDLNMKIEQTLRGADHYCLSSQFFFILTVFLSATFVTIMGLTTMFNVTYNLFDDIATIPIVIFWTLIVYFCAWILEKIAMKLNFWDYWTFQSANSQQNSKNSAFKIADQVNFDGSQFNTQNILFVDDFSRDNLVFKQSKKSIYTNIERNDENQTIKFSLRNIQKKKQKRPRIDIQNLHIQNFKTKDEIILARKRLQTICKKLQPLFQKESFKQQFSERNRDYIGQNIQKILPLVQSLPQLEQSFISQGCQMQSVPKSFQKQKNMQPLISEIITQWFRSTQKSRLRRINKGLQLESINKKCSFCYDGWAVYYGYGGICLNCSLRLHHQRKTNQQKNKKTIRPTKPTPNQRLNVITEEEEQHLMEGDQHWDQQDDDYVNMHHD